MNNFLEPSADILDPEERRKAKLLSALIFLLTIAFVLFVLWNFLLVLLGGERKAFVEFLIHDFAISLPALILLFWLSRTKHHHIVSIAFIFFFLEMALSERFFEPNEYYRVIFIALILVGLIIMAGLLFPPDKAMGICVFALLWYFLLLLTDTAIQVELVLAIGYALFFFAIFVISNNYSYHNRLQELKIAIDAKKKSEEILQHQKEELSEFVHTMAHDLRNHLLSIEGYAEILSDEPETQYVQKIRYLAQNSNEILRRSVALADAGLIIEKSDVVDLTRLARDVAEAILPGHILFELDDLPTVKGDAAKLSQVFHNIFENAVIHGKPSKIAVKRREEEQKSIVSIINDGERIIPEVRARIFQHGFTIEEKRGGLGLRIIQRIVEAHGRQIALEENPKTIFNLIIPADQFS